MKNRAFLFMAVLAVALYFQLLNVAFADDPPEEEEEPPLMEETITYGVRIVTTWGWNRLGWWDSSNNFMATWNDTGHEDYPGMFECDSYDCVYMMTNCASDFNRRHEYALGQVGLSGIGESFTVVYPGPPYTHNETWTVQFRYFDFVGIATSGCLWD